MKKRYRFLTALLGTFILTGCYVDLGFVKFGKKPAEEETPGGGTGPSSYDGYYKNCDMSLTGGRLQIELQRLCWEKHTQWVSYGQVTSYYATTADQVSVDAISSSSTKNDFFYTGAHKTGYPTGSNREHVWPCANSSGLWDHNSDTKGTPHYVDTPGYVGAGSDLYHVRPCEGNVNTSRGNARFMSFSDEEHKSKQYVEYGESSGKYKIKLYGATPKGSAYEFASLCEPDDAYKGDIARLVLYIYVHYTNHHITPSGGITKGSITYKYTDMVGTLPLTNIMGYQSIDRCKEILIAWNKLDPVSQVEKLRNKNVQKIQGNRNMFVDYPELVEKIFE